LREFLTNKRKSDLLQTSPSYCQQVGCQLVTVHSVYCQLGPIPASPPNRRSVFDRLSEQAPVKHHKRNVSQDLLDLPSASVNMIGRGRAPYRGGRVSYAPHSPSSSSPDSDYSPGLRQVLVHEEGVFRNTRSRVVIPYRYEQPSSSTTVTSPEPMRQLFQWSDEEDEDSGYASSAIVSSIRTDKASVHMADNGNDDLR